METLNFAFEIKWPLEWKFKKYLAKMQVYENATTERLLLHCAKQHFRATRGACSNGFIKLLMDLLIIQCCALIYVITETQLWSFRIMWFSRELQSWVLINYDLWDYLTYFFLYKHPSISAIFDLVRFIILSYSPPL